MTIEITRSNSVAHFSGALANNAIEAENIPMPEGWATANIHKAKIYSISIVSKELLDWEVQLFAKDTFGSTDYDVDSFITSVFFDASVVGRQNAGAGPYYYESENDFNPPLLYQDKDHTGEYHVILVCRDAATKSAGTSGECVVSIMAEPVL